MQIFGKDGARIETAIRPQTQIVVWQSPAYQRLGAACAIAGSLLNWVANLLHPKDFVAYDSAAHLRSIAADWSWSLEHFLFVLVAAVTLWGLIALADSLLQTPGAYLARLARFMAILATAVMAIFFIVDGFGMKAMAEVWLNAPPAEAQPALYSALLMTKLGLGTGSAYQVWYLGLLPLLFASAMLQGGGFPKWISLIALLGGVFGLAAGASFFLVGYSTAAVVAFVAAQFILALWVLAAGIVLYRRAGNP
jgi:hypothetical protein